MLKDIFISPQVFTEPTINQESWRDIRDLLENILNSGYLIGLKRKTWIKESKWNISKLEPKIKDRFFKIIEILNDRERIVDHPVLDLKLQNEDDWLSNIIHLHHKRSLHSIFSTHAHQEVLATTYLDDILISEEYGISGSERFVLSSEIIERILIPFLSYAKKLTIIDPYFYIDMDRYESSLRMIAKLLGERRGTNQLGSISIHCKSDESRKKNYSKTWRNCLNDIKVVTGHKIEVNCWRHKDGSIKMHDRYLITNQAGLVSAAGTNVDDFQQSEWSIKKYGELQSVLVQYKENSSPFEFDYRISTEE